MKNLFVIIILMVFTTYSYGKNPSVSKAEYCQMAGNKTYFKDLLYDKSNRMSFTNYGGLLNGGVCWWHSRFQRAAIYLTTYRPLQNKPNPKMAKQIIKQIRKRKNVVAIPGFNNFREFSADFKKEIHKALERWQILDGFVYQSWIIGLSGKTKIKAQKLKIKMNELYHDVVINNNISYQMLQFKGIAAHAWFVIDMEKLVNGYNLTIVDSNSTEVKNYLYKFGDENFTYRSYTPFVPYLQRKTELKRIFQASKRYCL